MAFQSSQTLSMKNLFRYSFILGSTSAAEVKKRKNPISSRFCGPSSDEFVIREYQRTISLYNEIKSEGYKPSEYPHSSLGEPFLFQGAGKSDLSSCRAIIEWRSWLIWALARSWFGRMPDPFLLLKKEKSRLG